MTRIMPTCHSTAANMGSSWPCQQPARAPDPGTIAGSHPRWSRVHCARRRACCKTWSASLVCAVILLGGCQYPPAEFKEVDAAGSAIRFEHSDFQPELSEYTVQRDPRTGTEVHLASFHGADTLGMLAALKAGPGYVYRERSTESMVADLMAEDTEIRWGARGGTVSGVGYTQYRLFQITGQPLSCVGFAQMAGQSSDDRNWQSNAVFGYFCHDASRPMTTESAEDLLALVKLSRRS